MPGAKMAMPKPFTSFPSSAAGMGMKRLALKKIVSGGSARKMLVRKAPLAGMQAKPVTGLTGGTKGLSGSIGTALNKFGKNPSVDMSSHVGGAAGANLGTSALF